MSFRLLFWGDSSQNDSLADSFARQAESEFRNTHRSDFENLTSSAASALVTSESSLNFVNQESKPESINIVNAAVSELIQAVSDNKQSDAVSNKLVNLSTTISNVVESAANSTGAVPSEPVKAAKTDILNSANETINTVSQLINEEKPLPDNTITPNTTPTENTATKELNDLMLKMKSFLDSLRNKVISYLEDIQKPQVQNYYGVEDNLKDKGKKEELSLRAENQQKQLEETLRQKVLVAEDNKKVLKKQLKEETQSSEQLVERAKKSELDKILEKKLDEMRRKPLFDR